MRAITISLPGLAPAALAFSQTAVSPQRTLDRIKVHGKSLEGNLEGDSSDRDVSIYLPQSYATDRTPRYPVERPILSSAMWRTHFVCRVGTRADARPQPFH